MFSAPKAGHGIQHVEVRFICLSFVLFALYPIPLFVVLLHPKLRRDPRYPRKLLLKLSQPFFSISVLFVNALLPNGELFIEI